MIDKDSRKIRVLHYAPGFNSGGIESRLLDWYRNIDRKKIEFNLLKLNSIDDTYNLREFKQLGGQTYNLPTFEIRNSFEYFKKLNLFFKENQFDVVHVHDLSTGVFVLLAAKKAGIKCRILHSRTTAYLPNEKNEIIKKVLKPLTRVFATDYFACSYEAGVWAFGKKRANLVKIINNGIQTERFEFSQMIRKKIQSELGIENKFVVGSIGRLSAQKNILFLVDIFTEILYRNKNAVLVIVGEGSMRLEIEKKITGYGIEDSVFLVGEKSNVWEYYMAFDVFVGTSYFEGFGTTAIESQATGTPTVLSTGFPAVVCISDFATRIDLDAGIDKWVDAIIAFKENRFNSNAISIVENSGYSAKNVSKYLESFYSGNNN